MQLKMLTCNECQFQKAVCESAPLQKFYPLNLEWNQLNTERMKGLSSEVAIHSFKRKTWHLFVKQIAQWASGVFYFIDLAFDWKVINSFAS